MCLGGNVHIPSRVALLQEIYSNSWAYIPRVRHINEVDNCDVLFDTTNQTFSPLDRVFSLGFVRYTGQQDNDTRFRRVELIKRQSFYSSQIQQSHPRLKKLYVEIEVKKSKFQNSKLEYV